MKIEKHIQFLIKTDQLKLVNRKTRPIGSDRRENDAEHSWQLALMALVLKEYSNSPIDINKVITMLIIHDLPEIIAGDTFLFDTINTHDHNDYELKAARELHAMLPQPQGQELFSIWNEFENGDSPETQFAKAIDRFAPVLLNFHNQGGTWKEFNINYEHLLEKLRPIQQGSEVLWQLTLAYLKELLSTGHIR